MRESSSTPFYIIAFALVMIAVAQLGPTVTVSTSDEKVVRDMMAEAFAAFVAAAPIVVAGIAGIVLVQLIVKFIVIFIRGRAAYKNLASRS